MPHALRAEGFLEFLQDGLEIRVRSRVRIGVRIRVRIRVQGRVLHVSTSIVMWVVGEVDDWWVRATPVTARDGWARSRRGRRVRAGRTW